MEELPVDSLPPKKKPNAFKCLHPGCSATFSKTLRLESHLNVHKGELPYRCDADGCSRAYTNNSSLQRHKQLSHNPLFVKFKYKCLVEGCLEKFSTTTNVRRHIERIHLKQHPFTCGICNKGFKTDDKLKAHEFEHTSISPFRCELCGTGCLTAYDLRRHNRKHKKLVCTICELEFNDAMLLRKHRGLAHKKSYNCSSCGKLFYNKALLAQHEGVHLDPSQRVTFPCPYETCSRLYYAKKNVEYHVRAFHQGKKERKSCHVCLKSLSCKQTLKQHLQRHVREGVPADLPPDGSVCIIVNNEVDVKLQGQTLVNEETAVGFKQEIESGEDEVQPPGNESSITNDLGNSMKIEIKDEYVDDDLVLKSEPVVEVDDWDSESKDPFAVSLQISTDNYLSSSENRNILWTDRSNYPVRTDNVSNALLVKTEPSENMKRDPVL